MQSPKSEKYSMCDDVIVFVLVISFSVCERVCECCVCECWQPWHARYMYLRRCSAPAAAAASLLDHCLCDVCVDNFPFSTYAIFDETRICCCIRFLIDGCVWHLLFVVGITSCELHCAKGCHFRFMNKHSLITAVLYSWY